MGVFTGRIIGFRGAPAGLDGPIICRIFNRAIAKQTPPKYLSSYNDPLFRFHRWRANLRILEVEEIKTIPCTPSSHPFVERLIGTVRREYLDQTLFRNRGDLEWKLDNYQAYYTNTGVTPGWSELCRQNRVAYPHSQSQNVRHIPGDNIATDYFKPRPAKVGSWSRPRTMTVGFPAQVSSAQGCNSCSEISARVWSIPWWSTRSIG